MTKLKEYNIIGISGKMKSGKTLVAKYLSELLPDYTVVNFADKLKQHCSVKYGIPLSVFYEEDSKLKSCSEFNDSLTCTVRELMTIEGNYNKALFGEDIWIRRLLIECDPSINMIIGDVRFPNELEAIQRLGGITIRKRRSINDRFKGYYCMSEIEKEDPALYKVLTHESEVALDDVKFKHIIYSHDDLEDLKLELHEMIF